MIAIANHPTKSGCFLLKTTTEIARPIQEVFSFFADAMRLETITPPWLKFRVLTPPPIDMHAGTLIDYALRIHGMPVRWQSRISVWEPGTRFVDEQVRGPYKRWYHEHTFEECNGSTICHDLVEYAVPGGAIIDRLFVRRDLQRIFEYRAATMQRILNQS